MDTDLLDRSLGAINQASLRRSVQARQVNTLSLAPHIRFQGTVDTDDPNGRRDVWAHKSGVQSLAIDQLTERYALSGGADATIHLWDLEQTEGPSSEALCAPIGSVPKGDQSHKFGITSLSFYPLDPGLFVSSSYDHHVHVYDTNTLELCATFDISSKIYSHHMSPVATNVLIATASQHSSIRLIDLQSGSTLHSLAGHNGAVMSVAWSPRDEFILSSGGSDGTLRLWDIRRSASCLAVFDLEDSTGTFGNDGAGTGARNKLQGKAHVGGCNGLAWTEDGQYLISTGHDERVRVWNVATGANDLSHFGPQIRNQNISTVMPLVVPKHQTNPGQRLMFYPNDREILMFDVFEGTLLRRLRPPGAAIAPGKKGGGQRNTVNRITSLAWRKNHVELYSAHSDGHIWAWTPDLPGEAEHTEEEVDEEHDEAEAKKRKALDDIFQSLTKKPITFI